MNDLDMSEHRAIVKALIDGWTSYPIDDSTKAVKDVMHKLCRKYLGKLGAEYYGTLQSDDGKKYHEWLLDVVWYLKTKKEERGMFLGLESEWCDKVNEVASDFCKLLAVKAPLKIIVFEAGTATRYKAKDHIKELNRIGRTWRQHSKGDLLYAINFHDSRCETYFYEIEKDGSNPSFKLEIISDLSAKTSDSLTSTPTHPLHPRPPARRHSGA